MKKSSKYAFSSKTRVGNGTGNRKNEKTFFK